MGLVHWPTFFITIAVTTLFTIVFIILRLKMGTDSEFRTIRRTRLKKYLRTGDILVVAYGSKRAKLVKVFTGSMWTHCAIVLRDQDVIKVMEVARYSPEDTGIVVRTLEEWLAKNENCIVAYRSYNGPPITKEQIYTFLKPRLHVKVDLNVVSWLKSMYKFRYKEQLKDKLYCSEFITHFLQECNVLKKKYQPAGYKPWELLYGDLPLVAGHDYYDPVLIGE